MQAIDIRDILKASGLTKRVAFRVGAAECGIGGGASDGGVAQGDGYDGGNAGGGGDSSVGGVANGVSPSGTAAGSAECVFDEPLAVRAELANVNGIIRVKANVRTSYRTFCARCLKALRVPIDKDFAEEFVGAGTAHAADDMYTYADKELDMADALHDAALLEIPIRHLCSEDCKSLCPSCGKDLNKGDCGCGAAEAGVDARFAVLLGFSGAGGADATGNADATGKEDGAGNAGGTVLGF